MNQCSKKMIIAVMLVSILAGAIMAGAVAFVIFEKKVQDYNALLKEYTTLMIKYNVLVKDYNAMVDTNLRLKHDYGDLVRAYDILGEKWVAALLSNDRLRACLSDVVSDNLHFASNVKPTHFYYVNVLEILTLLDTANDKMILCINAA